MAYPRRAISVLAVAEALLTVPPSLAAEPQRLAQVEELSRMSLQELASVEVTSVAKSEQSLSEAPAAIYVITREEILRSGVQSIPEALRLAPNMQVAQLSSSGYAITARGFGDKREVQTQANKLLILIDGRTVYSPLFSGVFYDAIDVFMDDIERIEVISGPGATLWGANAVNGVINIITRSTTESRGTSVRVGGGGRDQVAAARFGSTIGREGTYRLYGIAFERGSLELADGSSAHDRWTKAQGGVRFDWSRGSHAITFQGDVFRGDQSLLNVPEIGMSGANALVRWESAGERSQIMVQAYYDHTDREAPSDGAPFQQDIYDIEFQHSMLIGSANQLIWGAGTRVSDYDIENRGSLQFRPPHRSLDLTTAFVQDTLSAWTPTHTTLVWAAASRAIRSPTPFDADVAELIGPTVFLVGNPEFRDEEVTAYQLGYRAQPSARISLSASVFYNEYDDVRTVEPSETFIPLRWENRLEGETYGVEAWANFQVTSRWRLSPGIRTLNKRMEFEPGASALLDAEQSGNDPRRQAQLKSSLDLAHGISLDAFLRYVGELPDPVNDEYFALSARIGWRVSKSLELSASAFNLLDDLHTEYASPTGATIPRSFLAEVRWHLE
jgi:iron complex outermembrane receptor protein